MLKFKNTTIENALVNQAYGAIASIRGGGDIGHGLGLTDGFYIGHIRS